MAFTNPLQEAEAQRLPIKWCWTPGTSRPSIDGHHTKIGTGPLMMVHRARAPLQGDTRMMGTPALKVLELLTSHKASVNAQI